MTAPAFIRFGGAEVPPLPPEEADIVVLPVCYEHAPSYGGGSGDGPYHILHASAQLERMDEETLLDWGTLRIHTRDPLVPASAPPLAVEQIDAAAGADLAAGRFLLALGGDHAVSIGLIRAASRVHPGIGVLQVDAHADLRQEWNGSPYNHACVMRRVIADFGLRAVQVGIRSFSPEEAEFMARKGLAPFFAHRIAPGDESWVAQAVAALPETVYLTVDLDGLDPSVLPGTGTPEPGGLTYRQLVALIREVGRERRVVAADINELVKIEGTQVSEYTAAKIATKILVHCARRR